MKKYIAVTVNLFSDGSDTAVLDLERDPYLLHSQDGTILENQFVGDRRVNTPTDVALNGSVPFAGYTVVTGTLTYPLATFTFSGAPAAGLVGSFDFYLVF